ncbi:MAG TPA: CGNR zinc finger domain-containing protein [Gemmatimonadales bacterium]|jgi:predicted RNA-binding Zn ribbon-like protein|nr:CGNR zinc finger domain-containing protein [Gemmatimonadales bacterium]
MSGKPPEAGARNIATMELVGGRPVVDFVNTLSDRALPAPLERLASYDELVLWCVREELIDRSEQARLRRLAVEHPRKAAAALMAARQLRELLFLLFDAGANGRVPPPAARAELNDWLLEAARHRRLEPSNGGLRWLWYRGDDDLDWMLWPLAWSAAELLGSDELGRLKECAQEDCRWLFLDLSKNRSRRWCTMEQCGNRAKAKRHYERRASSAKR